SPTAAPPWLKCDCTDEISVEEETSMLWSKGLLNYENKEEHDCCHSCEDVRDTFRNKGWGVTNPDLIDQVRC
ncbi:unnamed protein product, partial [Brassica oleracea]